jgi:hypothetical protein
MNNRNSFGLIGFATFISSTVDTFENFEVGAMSVILEECK